MPIVRLSGTVRGEQDPSRSIRARLLYQLFSNGWDIYNSNGDQRITLSNIEKKIVESDAFVFTPGATLEDMFKAVSIFVGYQTLDRNLNGKATVLLNEDGSWDDFYQVLDHLRGMGTIQQDARNFLLEVRSPDEVPALLAEVRSGGLPDVGRQRINGTGGSSFELPAPAGLRGNVCVFCSATIEDEAYLRDGEELGRRLARHSLGCVSGAGRSGVMGAVVKGASQAGGWTGGSNVPHIIALEGLPEGLSSFWLRPDIYTRMEVMIERSDAFVIFPGGAGTLQELLALLIFKQQGNPLMRGKEVVVFNRVDARGVRFWDPLIGMLGPFLGPHDLTVADDLDEVMAGVQRRLPEPAVAGAP
jgi:hypothetical protein